MHTYILCIGSNYDQVKNLAFARQRLTALFSGIRFADEKETEPFLFTDSPSFLNQVALFKSVIVAEEVTKVLKTIEKEAGRLPEDKLKAKVVLDIDLLTCDNVVLKPKDMERDYVKAGIKQLINT